MLAQLRVGPFAFRTSRAMPSTPTARPHAEGGGGHFHGKTAVFPDKLEFVRCRRSCIMRCPIQFPLHAWPICATQ